MNSITNDPQVSPLTVSPEELFGPSRHKYIAVEADKRLSDKARAAVAGILSPLGQNSLGEIANWADEIKGEGPDDDDTKQFLKDFPGPQHKAWHFVDLPLGVSGYDRVKYAAFTNDTDVVQMIGKSVKILQGNLNIMSKVNALRWLTHLVGDLHQPLHVACGYLDYESENPELLSDPEVIVQKGLTDKSDHGGNNLILSLDKDTTLHSYWDSIIPEGKPSEIAARIKVIAPEGLVDQWAEHWALDSVLKSRIAYQSLSISKKEGKKFRLTWEGKKGYDARCAPLVAEQLVLGSQRLALMVNEIFK